MLDSIVLRNDLHKSVLVSVRGPQERFGKTTEQDALGVIEWHMPASFGPNAYTISVPSQHGISRMISRAGNFVVNFVGRDNGPNLAMFSQQDGSLSDLFSLMGVTKEESRMVESPSVKEAKATLECELVHELESGDHTVFIGRVLHSESRK